MNRCRFCGCTADRACRIPIVIDDELRQVPCSWLAPGICTAPTCVERAYREARELAEQITEEALLAGFIDRPSEEVVDWFVQHGAEFPG